ncbi:CD99 antigen-like protein 2 [Bagarius yarrelli]|uniref:CD99 antigen-like protein 2 n=1 Tax=Bagarius yarrelli TaxID=175774 RepID=A0A556TYZ5_BAGYA|nr:CD99 antigen-like protein 2 [Bagarius yarrelli]
MMMKHAHINNSGFAGLLRSGNVQVALTALAHANPRSTQVQNESSMGFGDCGKRGDTIAFWQGVATPKPKENEHGGGPIPVKPTIKSPIKPKEPVKPTAKPKDPGDFSLYDALPGKDKKNENNGGQFSDDDLLDLNNDGYQPDKGTGGKKGSGGSGGSGGYVDPTNEADYDNMPETGTIAGIVSAVAMALVGAVSSYISYQKKKFCFSIQQSLNADMVKAENPEAVVAQEPQATCCWCFTIQALFITLKRPHDRKEELKG